MKLHIVSPDIREGDAVGNHCIYLAQALRKAGVETALYALRHNSPEEPVLSIDALLATCRAEDALLLSFSTFQPQLPALLRLPCRKIVYFHGVTPVELLLEHDPTSAYWSSKALLQLPQLAHCDHFIANSHWNLEDLLKHFEHRPGEEHLDVIPPITPGLPVFREPPRVQPQCDPFEVMVVGRVAPHKKIEWAIEIVARLVNKGFDVHLRIIGPAHNDHYLSLLKCSNNTLQLQDRVRFEGQVTQAELIDAFHQANALLITSEHEGFCIPVLEAMHMGLPAIIRVGTAASEVGGDAVASFSTVDEGTVALQQLIQEAEVRHAMVKSGRLKAAKWLEQASAYNWLKQLSTD